MDSLFKWQVLRVYTLAEDQLKARYTHAPIADPIILAKPEATTETLAPAESLVLKTQYPSTAAMQCKLF